MGLRFDARQGKILTDASAVDFDQPVQTAASTTAAAGLNIPEAVAAPTAPVDGDVWVTAAGAFNARLNGATVDLAAGGGGNVSNTGTPVNNQLAIWTDATTIEGDAKVTFDGSSFAAYGDGTAPDSHYFGTDANNRWNFETNTNFGTITFEDDNVSTETQTVIFDMVSSSTGAREYQFWEGGIGPYVTFDITNANFTFAGTLELTAQTDHPASISSGGAIIWPKSKTFGEELLYTTGDNNTIDHPLQNAHTHVWYFDVTTTAADPGAGEIRFNSGTPASVTSLYINDTESSGKDASYLLSNLADGDILKIKDLNDAADYLVCSVNGTPTDNTGWWTVPVTIIHSGSNPTGLNPIHVEVEWSGSQAGGITGTVANDQVVVGTGASAVDSSANLTFSGTALDINASVDINGGNDFRIYDSGNDDFIQIDHSGTLATLVTAGTGAGSVPIRLNPGSGNYVEIGGAGSNSIPLRISDGDSSDYLEISSNGTDINFTVTGGGSLDFADNTLRQLVLEDYAIESSVNNVSGTTVTFTYANGPVFECDMEAATGAVTATLSGGPPAGTHGQITVKVTQDTTVRTLTWAGGTFRWAGGTEHPVTTTANGFTIFTFETWDGGTIWYGAGADYS